MIARSWTGRTRAHDADAYARYLDETGVPELAQTKGNRGVIVLRRMEGGAEAEFTVISLWESMVDVRRFTGPNESRARYYPEDGCFLLDMPPTLPHHEVVRAVWNAGLRVGA